MSKVICFITIIDNKTARYISQDPIGLIGGLNFYKYVGNNPIMYVDPYGLKECKCSATFTAVGPRQAQAGALGRPVSGSVAISPRAFGLPYDSISERESSQAKIREKMSSIRISAPDLIGSEPGTEFSIGDVGDRNIRNSSTTRFDIYRFSTQRSALQFGRQTVDVVITGVPDDWQCPE